MNPLENLQDIHNPAEIGLWPFAYGWWILAFVILLVIVLSTKWLLKYYAIRKNKKLALQELKQINRDEPNYSIQINQLLKRVCMVYFPSTPVQKLHGDEWAQFLLATLPSKQEVKLSSQIKALQNNLYRKHSETTNTSDLNEIPDYQSLAANWIKIAVPPSNKTKQKLEQNYA
ncbi:DUF4381 domain-containing protein [Paraglaciecola sp.]|uniref:DUF4381 domain-containing protein n=1 Tax=Paraglaciecola sp. TaxID=1920173 RepID=UPI003EF2E146